ncbi:thioredoxin domain-containing protein [Bacillus sp. Bva_UNVM-123]|uniref:thioredoxin domain-containing protein n=1 Tax=Bacillus sp. Bva_UNVM-123 TaxID=2829798 RepID=UPI00391EF7F9
MKSKNKRSSNKGRIIAIALGLVTLIGIILVFTYTPEPDKENAKTLNIEGQPTIGEKDAKVQIVEMGDIMCPACKAWSMNYFPYIKEKYVDTGKVSFSFTNVLFHGDESKLGAQAFEAVYALYPDYFWDYLHNLYEVQPENTNHDEVWLNEDVIIDVAIKTIPNFNQAEFIEKMNSEEVLEQINIDQALVEETGLQLTPGIFINGVELTDPFDGDKIIELIEEGLK